MSPRTRDRVGWSEDQPQVAILAGARKLGLPPVDPATPSSYANAAAVQLRRVSCFGRLFGTASRETACEATHEAVPKAP
jgi:hypothetical protein